MSADPSMPPRTTILLTRHGLTDWNEQARYQGSRSDIPLSAVGVAQVKALSAALSTRQIDAAYTSPAERARRTASIVLDAVGAQSKPLIVDDLRESDFGDWEGLTYAEIVAEDAAAFEAWTASPSTAPPPGGETLQAVADRVWVAIKGIAQAHPGQTVLIATHGGPIKACLATALGMPLDLSCRLNVSPASLSVLLFYGEYHYLDLANYVAR